MGGGEVRNVFANSAPGIRQDFSSKAASPAYFLVLTAFLADHAL